MASKDPRIDAYIARSAAFAQPILKHIRKLVHAACPEVEETLKWSTPHFTHKGILCSMAAFKHHCAFGFWKGALIIGNDAGTAQDEAMGQFGRITAPSDLPADKVLIGYIKKAVHLNDTGVKVPARSKPKVKKELDAPDELQPQEGVRGMDHRSQTRRDPHSTIGNGDRMDGRRKAKELEVCEMLSSNLGLLSFNRKP